MNNVMKAQNGCAVEIQRQVGLLHAILLLYTTRNRRLGSSRSKREVLPRVRTRHQSDVRLPISSGQQQRSRKDQKAPRLAIGHSEPKPHFLLSCESSLEPHMASSTRKEGTLLFPLQSVIKL